MAEDHQRGAELIEQLLTDAELRARFRTDPGSVLEANGLSELADGLPAGPRALMTLELRESRSSLAGVMVAAAAEGVDLGHLAEHALPHLGRDAGHAIGHAFHKLTHHVHRPAKVATPASRTAAKVVPSRPKPAPPTLALAELPAMAHPVHHVTAPAYAPQTYVSPTTQEPTAPATPDPSYATHASLGGDAAGHAADAAASAIPANPLQYPGNDATPQELARWMGASAQRAGLPSELPVMASLTESGMRNLEYGDRDSVGFFQMRTSIWNEGPYAGYLSNPQLQMKWFINEALAVKAKDPALADSPSSWGEWVADIEQPATAYRGRYQLQLEHAQELLHDADLAPISTHVVDAVTSPKPLPGGLQGAEYLRAAYAQDGLKLPGQIGEQFDVGASVRRAALRPGDAVFFGSTDGTPAIVGIYAGRGEVTMGSGGRLESIAQLTAGGEHYLGARRYSQQLLTGSSSYARVLPMIK